MKIWDAIIVGAGPAGCACAYDLAAAGRQVLLLDKAVFPRVKACAGGLTMKAVRALRYSVEPVVRQTVCNIALEGPERMTVRGRKPVCVMTVRQELDAFCLQQTLALGTAMERVSGIEFIEQSENGVTLASPGRTWRARFVIGADGVHSRVRQLLGNDAWFRKGVAMEANLVRDAVDDDLVFDFSPVAGGYGWVFPKRDHVNVGLYCADLGDRLNRTRLAEYLAQRYGKDAKGRDVVGQYVGFGAAGYEASQGRVFLVGDAGGFVDPLTGEGIYGAVVSGQAAAAAIADGPEEDAWRRFAQRSRRLRQNLKIAERAATSFYANPSRGFQAMKIPLLRSAIIKSYADGLNLAGLLKVAHRLLPFT